MSRIRLFEFEDQRWFPAFLRRYMTDYLHFTAHLTTIPFEALASRLARALRETGDTRLIDLCSGGGGPLPQVIRLLKEKGVSVTGVLTDLYPNLPAFERRREDSIEYSSEPVDATRVPAGLRGFRTLFNSFHHFGPENARKILESAAQAGEGILVYELVGRSFFAVLSISTLSFGFPLLTPFIKPRKLSRFLFTYLVPLVPFFTIWDGLVSCLRVYSPEELRRMTDSIDVLGYSWEIGKMPFGKVPGYATYLLGTPDRDRGGKK